MVDNPEFLSAILDRPADDAPRMVYADWLEENAGDGVCPQCRGSGKRHVSVPNTNLSAANGYSPLTEYAEWRGCRVCSKSDNEVGSGRVSDGRRERAAFIRVQCELARLDDCGHAARQEVWLDGSCRVCPLRRREREMFVATLGVMMLRDSDGLFSALDADGSGTIGHTHPANRASVIGVVRRGFVESVTLPAAAFCGGPCGTCNGEGVVRTDTGGNDWQSNCRSCGGTDLLRGSGTLPGLAGRLFAVAPVTRVVLTDKSPMPPNEGYQNPSPYWYWTTIVRDGSNRNIPDALPVELFAFLPKADAHFDSRCSAGWKTAEAAHAALIRACVAYGRSFAKLPALPEIPDNPLDSAPALIHNG